MKTEKNLRAADLLARRFYQAGCRYAFGMPGGEVLTVVDALEKAGVQFILCKNENSAGFMAEGAHHMTGAPGILVATVLRKQASSSFYASTRIVLVLWLKAHTT